MKRRYLSVVLGCAAVAIGGCGGAGSTTGTVVHQGPPPASVFVPDVNALCKSGNAALAKVRNDPAKLLEVVEQYLPKFQAINPSGVLRPVYKRFLTNLAAEINALKAGNVAAARAAGAKNKVLAKTLHATACA